MKEEWNCVVKKKKNPRGAGGQSETDESAKVRRVWREEKLNDRGEWNSAPVGWTAPAAWPKVNDSNRAAREEEEEEERLKKD